MITENIVILLVEDNKDFAKLLTVYLDRFEKGKFSVIWKENASDALKELTENTTIDVVLMDYFLPGKNGLEITKEMLERKIRLPIVFLTVNKDFDVVIKVMKLGVSDYLVKEEISSPILPKTILSVIEKHRLQDKLMQIEVSQQRLNIIRETVSVVLDDLQRPLFEMKDLSVALRTKIKDATRLNYLRIVDENLLRIAEKLNKLKELKEDKTVQYIKDIKMLDLS